MNHTDFPNKPSCTALTVLKVTMNHIDFQDTKPHRQVADVKGVSQLGTP